MNEHDPDASPFNPLPSVVVALALVIFGIECLFLAGNQGLVGGPSAIGWRLEALQSYAFAGTFLDYLIQTGSLPARYLIRFVSYAFVQADFTQTLWVCALLLALGKFVGEVFRPVAILVIFLGAAIGGALAFGLFTDGTLPLIGGFPAVYGLIGAYTWLLWVMSDALGQSRLAAFRMIGLLMGLQLVFGVLFGGGLTWIADLGGFASGFVLSFVVSPGGVARLLARLRR